MRRKWRRNFFISTTFSSSCTCCRCATGLHSRLIRFDSTSYWSISAGTSQWSIAFLKKNGNSHCFRDTNISHFWHWNGRPMSYGTTFVMVSFYCQIWKYIKVVRWIFALALTVSEILTFQMFDLLKVGQGHGVQFLQCCPAMANDKICKSCYMLF